MAENYDRILLIGQLSSFEAVPVIVFALEMSEIKLISFGITEMHVQ